ncbi:MAG: pyruvate kinase [Candidatus Moraniibacteriota bacterium]
MSKKTKIVATIGPASESKETLRQMIDAGMNVARLNFSHGEHAWHATIIARIRELSEELGVPIAILADLQGPRIRTEMAAEQKLSAGDTVHFSDIAKRDDTAAKGLVYLDLPGSIENVKEGDSILIEDGTLEFQVTGKEGSVAEAVAKNAGVLKPRKGVILPDTHLELDILSEKDRSDLAFVLEEGVDYVGLSFVGSAVDVKTVQTAMREQLGTDTPLPKIVSKIERKLALENLDGIIRVSDAIMVARGDLGIEMPESEIAVLQKRIIQASLRAAKPVIVATQMMKSMTENPRPTRAEVSDVSNAVIDHTDAVMLSEESAMGKYPVETIRMMAEIIEKTETSPFDDVTTTLPLDLSGDYAVLIRSLYELAKSFRAKATIILSMSGFTARLLSHFRPEAPLLVATDSRATYQELALVWGAEPYLFEGKRDYDHFATHLIAQAKKEGKLNPGDQVAVFSGRTPDEETMRLVGIREVR